jgi:hypothetical protein
MIGIKMTEVTYRTKYEVLDFTPLPAGWWNYDAKGNVTSPCPGMVNVKITSIYADGEVDVSTAYVAANISEGYLEAAVQWPSYEFTDYDPTFNPNEV